MKKYVKAEIEKVEYDTDTLSEVAKNVDDFIDTTIYSCDAMTRDVFEKVDINDYDYIDDASGLGDLILKILKSISTLSDDLLDDMDELRDLKDAKGI